MNEEHLRICSSPEWASYVAGELMPWVLASYELGDDVLELGPGPGVTTYVLGPMVPRLIAVEIDQSLGASLARRLAGTNVTVLRGDGARLPFQPARFSAATLFTMLHHVPSSALQDRLLAEARRVLRPGGLIVGTDGLDTPQRREVHAGDVFVPVDPASLPGRLTTAGFTDPVVEVTGDRIRFAAHAPALCANPRITGRLVLAPRRRGIKTTWRITASCRSVIRIRRLTFHDAVKRHVKRLWHTLRGDRLPTGIADPAGVMSRSGRSAGPRCPARKRHGHWAARISLPADVPPVELAKLGYRSWYILLDHAH